jgi:hypothetical protein
MNYLKNIFTKSKGKTYSLLTGGHLRFTKDIIYKLGDKTQNYLVLHKDYIDHSYDDLPNVRVFNCDVSSPDDITELLLYLKEDIKVIKP